MKIDKEKHLKTLWYEDMDGNVIETKNPYWMPPSIDCPYIQVARFPSRLVTSHLKVDDKANPRCKEIMSMNQTWNQGLVLNIANSGDYSLNEAIIIAATSCERCLNVLIHKYGGYGADPGYAEYSEEWLKCGTSCLFCKETAD